MASLFDRLRCTTGAGRVFDVAVSGAPGGRPGTGPCM